MDETEPESGVDSKLIGDLSVNGKVKPGLNQEMVKVWAREQPVWKTITKLQENSRFKRTNPLDCETTIERDGLKYNIERINNPVSEDVKKAHDLLRKTFKPDEVEPLENLKNASEPEQSLAEGGVTSHIYTVKDAKGEIVSLLKGNNIDLKDDDSKSTGKTVFMVDYAVTDPALRQSGLAREAYISALMDISRESEAEGRTLLFASGEAVGTAEDFWNKVGWKRAYVQIGEDARNYEEVQYTQPAMEFDPDTGEIAGEAGAAPEHFMVDGFGVHTPSKGEVSQAMRGMYSIYLLPRDEFNSDVAYQKHSEHINGIVQQSEKLLNSSGRVIFLDKIFRDRARSQGVVIGDFTLADEGVEASHAGPQDM